MTKVVMKFFKGHGPYVKGDIAGFDPEKAAKLTSVARPYDEKADKEFAKQLDRIGTEEAKAMIEDANADFAAKAAALDAREAALAEREAAVSAASRSATNAGEADAATKVATAAKDKKTGKGEPPAQGADTAAKS